MSFEGHWGFQYYMQAYHFQPIDFRDFHVGNGDLVVIPDNSSYATGSIDTIEYSGIAGSPGASRQGSHDNHEPCLGLRFLFR